MGPPWGAFRQITLTSCSCLSGDVGYVRDWNSIAYLPSHFIQLVYNIVLTLLNDYLKLKNNNNYDNESSFVEWSSYILNIMYLLQCVQKKVSPPNILHWQVQTCPVLNKIKHALAQKYLSYCCQISYDSIIPLNRFSIFTNCCHRFQLPTWLANYARRTSLTSRMTHFVDKQNVVKRR